MEPAIFFSASPRLGELCALTVSTVDFLHSLAPMQPHIIKCREMIFTESDILASPSVDMEACFHIIAQRNVLKSGRLQNRLQSQGLKISPLYPVHPSLYQTCLLYSVKARLAPSWNLAGDWFLQGRDFLTHDGYTNAIKLNLQANQEEVFVSLEAAVVKFPPLQVEDLDVSQREMVEIIQSTQGDGPSLEVQLDDSWCHVMPSLKRARVVSLSLVIPETGPFKSYAALKRYWKNTYGYRLPETDEDILYCQVTFLHNGPAGKLFTYPNVCLRAGPMRTAQRTNPKPILSAFLQDLHAKHGRACGHPLRFEPKLRYVNLSLYSASQSTACPNLTNKKRQADYGPVRSFQSIQRLYQKHKVNQTPLQLQISQAKRTHQDNKNMTTQTDRTTANHRIPNTASSPNQDTPSKENQIHEKGHGMPKSLVYDSVRRLADPKQNDPIDWHSGDHRLANPKQDDPIDSHYTDSFAATQVLTHTVALHNANSILEPFQRHEQTISKDLTTTYMNSTYNSRRPFHKHQDAKAPLSVSHPEKEQQDISQQTPNSVSKYVPIFRPKSKPKPNQPHSQIGKVAKLRPEFKAKQALSLSQPIVSCQKMNNGQNKTSSLSPRVAIYESHNSESIKKQIATNGLYFKSGTSNHWGAQGTAGIKSPCTINSYIGKAGTPEQRRSPKPGTPNLGGVQSATSKAIPFFRPQFKTCGVSKSIHLGCNPSPKVNMSPFRPRETMLSGSSLLAPSSAKPGRTNGTLSKINTPTGSKRQAADQSDGATPKRARSKPAIQAVNVEDLARAGQLDKVNVVTLSTWLKERSQRCPTKDRKSDLVDKVKRYLGLTEYM